MERGCSDLLRTEFRFVVTEIGGCAIDIDTEHEYDVASQRYREWREAQDAVAERRYGPLPLPARAGGPLAGRGERHGVSAGGRSRPAMCGFLTTESARTASLSPRGACCEIAARRPDSVCESTAGCVASRALARTLRAADSPILDGRSSERHSDLAETGLAAAPGCGGFAREPGGFSPARGRRRAAADARTPARLLPTAGNSRISGSRARDGVLKSARSRRRCRCVAPPVRSRAQLGKRLWACTVVARVVALEWDLR